MSTATGVQQRSNTTTSNEMGKSSLPPLGQGHPPLERILMRKHGIKYMDAKRLENKCRQKLKMSRIEQWSMALLEECENELKETGRYRENNNMPNFMNNNENIDNWLRDIPAQQQDAVVSINKKSSKNTITVEQIDATEDETDESSDRENEIIVTESPASSYVGEIEARLDEHDDGEIEDDDVDGHPVDLDEEEEEEYDDDECSYATDNSKCFTTAEEIGIQLEKPEDEEDDDEEEEDEEEEEENEEEPAQPEEYIEEKEKVEEPIIEKKVMTEQQHKKKEHKTKKKTTTNGKVIVEDHNTLVTESDASAESGVPTIIYIRIKGPQEVPDDEPLGEAYNIPESFLPKPSRRQRIRNSLMKSLRVFGFQRLRNNNNKTRLTVNDTECYVPTLVDI